MVTVFCIMRALGSLVEWFKPAVLTTSRATSCCGAAKTAARQTTEKIKYGSLGEWFKPAVLKTAEQKCSVSSNLTASASQFIRFIMVPPPVDLPIMGIFVLVLQIVKISYHTKTCFLVV